MSNHYIDPDMVGERGVNADPWNVYPPGVDSINDARYLLSCGPFEIETRDTLSLVIVYVAGEDFVEQFGNYDFTDIAVNASWAYRIYDNPGVDTPEPLTGTGDGYRGEFVLYDTTEPPFDDADTIWLTGDGVPDFVGPPPPPIPNLQIIPGNQKVTILWSKYSEKYKNLFVSSLPDVPAGLDTNYFEGYRVYRSKTGVTGEWTLLKEYDRVDFTDSTNTEPISWNRGMPHDTVIGTDTFYKLVDRNIMNYMPQYYAVTAFDKGWPFNEGSILPVLESSIEGNKTRVYPSPISDGAKEVIVIPNPYRASHMGRYNEWEHSEYYPYSYPPRRRICFANLPLKCTIRIYSLSGDLIKTIEHNYTQNSKNYEDWNLITKDIQEIVAGIYLFSVKNHSTGRIQVGKFVVIK